jgi:hypothetical protein
MMADIAKSGTPSLVTMLPEPANQDTGTAGEDIAAGDVVYRKASDGLIYKAGGATNDERYKYAGIAAKASKANNPCTFFHGVRFRYGAGMTINTNVMMAPVNAGLVADANGVNAKVIGRVVSATDIFFFALTP